MSARTSASEMETNPPPVLVASTEPLTPVLDVTVRSLLAARLAAPICTLAWLSTTRLDCALPTLTSPPPLPAEDAAALPSDWPVMLMSRPCSVAPAPTVVVTVGVLVARVVALPEDTSPMPEPLADAVTMPSPEGACVSARAPPTPPRACLPEAVPVRSNSRRPLPAATRSTPSVPSVCAFSDAPATGIGVTRVVRAASVASLKVLAVTAVA